MCQNTQFSANLVTFTKEYLNGKLHFLCSVQVYLEVNIHLRRNIFAYANFHKCRVWIFRVNLFSEMN